MPSAKNLQSETSSLTPSSKQGNLEFIARRRKFLRDSSAALNWLAAHGVSERAIKHFELGLSATRSDARKNIYGRALTAPVIGIDGVAGSKTVYLNVPGVTVNPDAPNTWMKGAPLTYYADARFRQSVVIVFSGLRELWRAWDEFNGTKAGNDSEQLLIASTHEDTVPAEWLHAYFWEKFDRIYLAQNGCADDDQRAALLCQSAGKEIRRLLVPPERGTDWCEFWQKGGTVSEFEKLIVHSEPVGAEISAVTGEEAEGRSTYQPVDILSDFNGQQLYYPVRAHRRLPEISKNSAGQIVTQIVEKIETVVVKSDRSIHHAFQSPAPRGTPAGERLLRLTDGTIIESLPKAGKCPPWSWDSVGAYLNGTNKKRPLGAILRDVKNHLRQSVWLPYELDYDLLTLLVPVTFAQTIFDSVPLVLVTGPAGSGKSQLGRAMTQICANASIIGQGSAAAIARLIHETRGFIVLDDLESIGRKGRGGASGAALFSELVQAIKLSYNKATSRKLWTDMSRAGQSEWLNFYGVKMINNTLGVDDILGSRMIRVETRRIPVNVHFSQNAFYPPPARSSLKLLNSLRDELHTWTFENVALIDLTYQRLFARATDRTAEISAPLKVFAEIAGNDELINNLESALAAKFQSSAASYEPIKILEDAVRKLISEGYDQISPTHVVLEMKSLIRQSGSSAAALDGLAWLDSAWTGWMLRRQNIVEASAAPVRYRLFDQSLRVYAVSERFKSENGSDRQENAEKRRKPLDFCRECGSCPYQTVGCPFIDARRRATEVTQTGQRCG